MDPPGAMAFEDAKDSEVLNEMDMKPAALKSLPPSIFDLLEHMQEESTNLDKQFKSCNKSSEDLDSDDSDNSDVRVTKKCLCSKLRSFKWGEFFSPTKGF